MSKRGGGLSYIELDELLATSEIVTLNLALNEETEGIISAARVESLKRGQIFINPSPMELMDFKALLIRLEQGDLTFMLDHTDEMSDKALKQISQFNNAILYPPIAYLTEEASGLKKQIYVDNLKNFLSGSPTNKVN